MNAIYTERTSAPAIIENHDARMVGTTATVVLASHLCGPTLLTTRSVVGKSVLLMLWLHKSSPAVPFV